MSLKDQTTSRGNLKKNHTTRVGQNFHKHMKEISNMRIEIKKDKAKIPIRVLTNLIIKHDYWPQMKADIINLDIKDIKGEEDG